MQRVFTTVGCWRMLHCRRTLYFTYQLVYLYMLLVCGIAALLWQHLLQLRARGSQSICLRG